MKLESDSAFWLAIGVSALLHLAMWVSPNRPPARTPEAIVQDRWATSSVEVSSEPAAQEGAPSSAEPAAPPAAPPRAEPAQATVVPARTRATPAPIRPRPSLPEPRAASAESPRADATAGDASSAPAGRAGSVGALELPPHVRHLAHAFTRALPASNYTDPAWTELPAGVVGKTELELVIDESGHIDEVKFDPRFPPAAVIERMVKNAVLLLKAGVFSIDARSVSAGVERLSVEVSLRDRPAPVPDAEARGLFHKGYDAPSAQRPGHASFTLNSGRHMEAVVRLLQNR